jgi:hypothetical protein
VGIPKVTRVAIHIVPFLPPQTSGVGDYAALAGQRMEESGDMACGYVTAGHLPVDLPQDGQRVRNISGKCRAVDLWRAVEEVADASEPSPCPSLKGRGNIAVVLHYSGYGYEQNGAPIWLADALRNRPAGIARVVTYFHELYANGWPWQKAFWYSTRQRHVAADIAKLSDELLTNREQSARWLEVHTGRPQGTVVSLPVTSNVGEPENIPPYEARPARAVTFGGASFKEDALSSRAQLTSKLLRRLNITEIIDIGAHTAIATRVFERERICVQQLGFQPPAEVGELLIQSRIGLMDYPADYAAKSGVFAAFAAHGVVPFVRPAKGQVMDGLAMGQHFFHQCEVANLDAASLAAASKNVNEWYQQHDSRRHAEAHLEALTSGMVTLTTSQSQQ